MKFTSALCLTAGLVAGLQSVAAFPAFASMTPEQLAKAKRFETTMTSADMDKRQNPPLLIPTVGKKLIPDANHPFQAPSATAQRGPCPGLNLMANHGYLNREGITSFQELAYAQQEVMGWAVDLATFLAAIAIALDGNPITNKVSIGGPDKRVGTIPILGGGQIPGGILRHNTYEIDSSLTRMDVAIGDNKNLNTTLWQDIWDIADSENGGMLNGHVMSLVRQKRYEESARDDPDFHFAPIGALFFFADQFLYNTMPTALDNGEPGPATRETISDFYGAKRTGERTWEYVPERMPKGWIRRARPLTIAEGVSQGIETVTDAAAKGQLPVGFTADDLTDPTRMVCSVMRVVLDQIPASIAGLNGAASFLSLLGSVVGAC